MKQLDLFYRAFKEYKEQTILDLEFSRFQKDLRAQNLAENEDIIVTFKTCKIEMDWVNAIEEGLPFIEKCIREERQFIKTESDVLPIEKIRKTSRQSVIDLAKHSNYISHERNENSDSSLVPDKLLMIQKDNEYSVYENRVLYACLIYLKDFMAIRLNAIKTAINSYKAHSYVKKNLRCGNRDLKFSLDLDETRFNDVFAIARSGAQEVLNRLDIALASVMSLLKTPLMIEVAKTDLVKRPITKTNVLKMNRNFKNMLQTFDYIASYEGKGYTIETVEKRFAPLQIENVDDYSEVIMLSSFISYIYANELSDSLEKEYQEEEERRRIAHEQDILEKVKLIKTKYSKEKGDIDKDIFLVMDEAISILEEKLKQLDEDNKALQKKLADEIARLNAEFELKRTEMLEAHKLELVALEETLNEEKRVELEKKDQEISECYAKHLEEMSQKEKEIENTKKACQEEVAQKDKELVETLEKYERNNSELLALRASMGIKTDLNDFTSKERFNELEREKNALDKMFKEAWKLTKKEIKKKVFAENPIKEKKEKEEDK